MSNLGDVGFTCKEQWKAKRKRANKKTHPPKICRFCGNEWAPKHGQAARLRTHCYDYHCEESHDEESKEKKRKNYRKKKKQKK